MSLEQTKALVRRYFEELVGRGRLELADELFHPDYHANLAQLPPDAPRGPELVRTVWRRWLAAFPDWTITINFQVAEGDLVASYCTLHGTHSGDLVSPIYGTFPATGKHASIEATVTFRVRDGKLYEIWDSTDFFGLFRQLGLLPLLAQRQPQPAS